MSVLVDGIELLNSDTFFISNNNGCFLWKRPISPEKLWQSIIKQNKNRHRRASLTTEAALVLPLFFFSVYLFWQCFLLLLLQLSVCREVTTIALSSTSLGYMERASEQAEDLSWLYEPLVWESLLQEERMDGLFVSFEEQEGGRMQGKVYYSFLCETVFFRPVRIPVVQSFSFFPYLGEYEKDRWKKEEEKPEVVYVTENGTVYHTSKSCVYLSVRLEQVAFSEIKEKRNRYGKRYTACSVCGGGASAEWVYVSLGGSRYHTKMDCLTLKRVVAEKKKEEVKLPLCSKCGGVNQ